MRAQVGTDPGSATQLSTAVGAPAVVALLAIIAAAISDALLPQIVVPPAVWLACTVVVGGVVVWAARVATRNTRIDALLVATVLVMFIAVAARATTLDSGPLGDLADNSGTAPVHYTIATEPRPTQTGWYAIVTVEMVGGTSTRQRAALTGDGTPPSLGSRWSATASAQPLPQTGFGQRLRHLHATALLRTYDTTQLSDGWWLAASSDTARSRVRDTASHFADRQSAGLLVGLVLGDTRNLADADRDAMRQVGMSHLTAVSGMHVALVAAGVFWTATLCRIPPTGRRLLTVAAILWFAYLTRLGPSVLRASAMALVVLAATTRGFGRDSRHALVIAVLGLVIIDPYLARSVGLQLSASATLGVMVLAPAVRRRLTWLPHQLAGAASVAIGAQIAVAPVLLATFGEFSVASVPANVVAVPAALFAAAISFVAAVVAMVAPTVAAALFWCASWPAAFVLAVAHTFADVGGAVTVARPSTMLASGAIATALLAATPRVRRLAHATTIVALVAVVVPIVGGSLPARDFTVTAIDVGQASAILIESRQARILVDAGEDDTASRWLRAHGRRTIDLLVITHPHRDHIGGGVDVLKRVSVGQIWLHPVPHELAAMDEFLAAANQREVPVHVPVTGHVAAVGDLVVEVVHPSSGRPYAHTASELNDMSIVLGITASDGRRVLVTGDIEEAAQRDILTRIPAQIAADVVVVPHHGAAASTTQTFLAATGAATGVISVGDDNRHGHPYLVGTHIWVVYWWGAHDRSRRGGTPRRHLRTHLTGHEGRPARRRAAASRLRATGRARGLVCSRGLYR